MFFHHFINILIVNLTNLFNILSTTFGAGDGSTTFNLPDLRNRTRVSVMAAAARLTSAVSGIDGTVVGSGGSTSESTTLTYSQIPPHTHGITDPGHTHTFNPLVGGTTNTGSGATIGPINTNNSLVTSPQTTGITINSTGGTSSPGGTAHTNVQPTIVAGLTFIKT